MIEYSTIFFKTKVDTKDHELDRFAEFEF